MTTLRICFVGDSVTLGTNDREYLGWPGRLAVKERGKGHDLTIYNLGVRADTSEQIAQRWQQECAARLPDIHPAALVFAFGINDAAIENDNPSPRVTLERSIAVARDMMGRAKAMHPVLWISPAPAHPGKQPFQTSPEIRYDFNNGYAALLSDAYAGIADDLGIPYFDLFTKLTASGEWENHFEGADGVHPVASGYQIMADRIEAWPQWRKWFD